MGLKIGNQRYFDFVYLCRFKTIILMERIKTLANKYFNKIIP